MLGTVPLGKLKEEESNQDYLQRYNNAVAALETNEITVAASEIIAKMEDKTYSSKSNEEKELAREEAANRFLAYEYLKGMDRIRYGTIKEELHNEYLKGQQNYPKTITEAYQLQTNYWIKRKPMLNKVGAGVSFMNKTGKHKEQNNNDDWKKEAMCHECGEKGHIRPDCPRLQNRSRQNDNNTNNDKHEKRETSNAQHDNNNDKSESTKNDSTHDGASTGFAGAQMSTFAFFRTHIQRIQMKLWTN